MVWRHEPWIRLILQMFHDLLLQLLVLLHLLVVYLLLLKLELLLGQCCKDGLGLNLLEPQGGDGGEPWLDEPLVTIHSGRGYGGEVEVLGVRQVTHREDRLEIRHFSGGSDKPLRE